MKFAIVVLACMVLAATNAASYHKNKTPGDKGYLEKQKFLLEIVQNIGDALQNENLIKYGGKLFTDPSKYEKYDYYMDYFIQFYKTNGVLPKGEFYAPLESKYHYIQGTGLAHIFYYAKDWDTFVRNVVWAREYVSEGLFVHALNYAVVHRQDMANYFLPQIYEILPQLFFNSKLVQKAEQYNPDTVQQQIAAQNQYIQQSNQLSSKYQSYIPPHSYKVYQWWNLMGVGDGYHIEQQNIQRNNIQQQSQDPNYQSVLSGIQKVWTPVDYTRDIYNYNSESKLSYFTEDVALNAYWYYLNLQNTPVYSAIDSQQHYQPEQQQQSHQHGERYLFHIQQLLARYYAERLSHGLGEIEEVSFFGIVKHGYDPYLIAYNGVGFSNRPNYYHVQTYVHPSTLKHTLSIESRILDAIESGKFYTRDGKVIDLTQPESAEFVADLIQGSIDVPNHPYIGYLIPYFTTVLSGGCGEKHSVVPNALQNYETMLRDPVTYQILKRVYHIYQQYKNRLRPYTKDDLAVPGVNIVDVQVSKLKTYFDLVDVDVTTLVNDQATYENGNYVANQALLARQLRLNHKPFAVDIKVNSDKAQQVVVRFYYAPVLDQNYEKIPIHKLQENVVQLDQFVYNLNVGENIISRNSRDNAYTNDDPLTSIELYNYVLQAYEGKGGLPENITESACGYPDRLALPHGTADGYPIKLLVVITPAQATQQHVQDYVSCGVDAHYQQVDNLPYGYPFDRRIVNPLDLDVPNIQAVNVKVYHTNRLEKYYPQTYEKYGTYDYTF